jgi:transcriptional regulator GlxA family with amidase domain
MEVGAVRISRAARHDIDFGPDGASCLVFQPDDLDGPRLPRARFLAADSWIRTLVARIGEAVARGAASPLRLDTLATELMAQVLRRLDGHVSAAPGWLARVPELVNDACTPLPVAAIAAEVGVHRVHLARVFRDHYGLSVTEYAHRVRLERARQLLTRGREPLVEVAAIAGFSDQSHMTRAVRAAFGTTPGAMRGALHPFKTRPERRR